MHACSPHLLGEDFITRTSYMLILKIMLVEIVWINVRVIMESRNSVLYAFDPIMRFYNDLSFVICF